jgi:hypothetical protein
VAVACRKHLFLAQPFGLLVEHDLSENRYPPRIKSGAGFFGIMLYEAKNLDTNPGERSRTSGGSYRDQAQVPADTHLCMSSCRTYCATNDA